MKNKKDLIYIIVIVLFALVIVGESIYIFKDKTPISKGENNGQEKLIYTGRRYLKENIVYDLPKDFNATAQIFHEDSSLYINLTSLEKIIVNSKLIVKYYDEKENLVKTDESNIGILSVNEPYVFNFVLPLMKPNVYAGKIVISLEKEYLENDIEFLDKSLLKFNYETSTNQANNTTNIALTADNPFEKINYYDGYVIAYKDDIIKEVSYISFENNKFEDGKITNNVYLNPDVEEGKITPLEFDKLEIVINSLY